MRLPICQHVLGCLAIIALIFSANPLTAQEDKTRQRYDQLMEEWRSTYVDASRVWQEFSFCEKDQADRLKQEYLELKAKGDLLLDETMLAAADCVDSSVTPDPQLLEFLQSGTAKFFEERKYRESVRVGKAILKHRGDDFQLLFDTVRSAFFDNQFTYAGELMDRWIEIDGKLPPELTEIRRSQQLLVGAWAEEQKLREAEAKADSLPRIEFELENGKVVVELFADQFPVVVNNLMWMVEQTENPFFVDQAFFFVLKHQLAMTGSRTDNGNEVIFVAGATSKHQESARPIFRGSFGLDVRKVSATQTVVSTGCQFFPIPRPDMMDSTLVVGRIVEGIELIDNLQETHQIDDSGEATLLEEAIPSRFIRAKVNRKPEGKVYEFIQPGQTNDDPKLQQDAGVESSDGK